MSFPPIDASGGNISVLPVSKRAKPDAALEVVHSYQCQHGNFLVDEKKAEVECGLCHEKLSPMWVLIRIANDDWRLREHWSLIKAEIELMKPKLRTKCKHCGQMTPIPTDATVTELQIRAEKIRRSKEADV